MDSNFRALTRDFAFPSRLSASAWHLADTEPSAGPVCSNSWHCRLARRFRKNQSRWRKRNGIASPHTAGNQLGSGRGGRRGGAPGRKTNHVNQQDAQSRPLAGGGLRKV
jgi:hypothetical protein